jgi:ribonucleoside-diphosphate reductase alpha chain
MDLKPEEHVEVQCTVQKWIDSSVSKTVNAPKGFNVKQVEAIYYSLWEKGAKGGTVYVDGSRDSQVLSLTNEQHEWDTIQTDYPEIHPGFRSDRQGRNLGDELGDLCKICHEGTLVNAAGCYTCNNCNVQLKCSV